jgi:hypothetical protein
VRHRAGIGPWWGALAIGLIAVAPARAADNPGIERLATCQDSWFEWKQGNPGQLQAFAAAFRTAFAQRQNDPFFVPRSSQSIAGLSIAQMYPESVGMGVGFSVVVNAGFDTAKAVIERKYGKPFKNCERGDNMRTCAIEVAEKKTITLMAEDNAKSMKTLVGCYYFYEK